MNTIIATLIVSATLALILGFLLGFFKKVFFVPVDEKVAAVRECLPGANCGGCGYAGCDGYAEAVAAGIAPADACSAGGEAVIKSICSLMGVEANVTPQIVVTACQGSNDCAKPKGYYNGVKTCLAVKLTINGNKMCSYGCIGYGDCVEVCKFDAISIGKNGLPVIDTEKCVGCGMCAKVCPQSVLSKVAKDAKHAFIMCNNKEPKGPHIIKNCSVACIKCGICEKTCPTGAIHFVNNLPAIDISKCTNCGDCVAKCPKKVIKLLNK
ncbi:MAG: RnfABCDGE type electron transport complex subunit B [Treponema sp.]|nr:RnfABCDGE type electron transport complex subunit B [Treponema sp.]